MPKVTPIQQAFNSGELSPLLYARTELEKYAGGCKILKNYLPTVQGPVIRRPGTHYVSEVKDSSKLTRLIPFEFSTTQAYVIEIGDFYMRFYRDNGVIVEADIAITGGITNANPAVVTAAAHGYTNGDHVYLANVGGMTEVNGRRFTVANATANTFELSGVNSTSYGVYTSGGVCRKVYQITTVFAELDIYDIKFVQSADVIYMVHPSYPPQILSRTGHTAWTIAPAVFEDGPYFDLNDTTTTLTASAASGTVTVTASAVTGINDDTGFQTTDVGRLIRMYDNTSATKTWGWGVITARASTTSVTVDIKAGTFDTVAQLDWRLGVWSATTGYPAAVAFFQDRLFFAGADGSPQRFDGSNVGDYLYFAPSQLADAVVTDAHSISGSINANDLNRIWWLADDEKGLAMGTQGGAWVLRANTTNDALTPTNARATRAVAQGSANISPVKVDKSTLYVHKAQRKLRELLYSFDNDGFKAGDLSVLAEHITVGGMVELAYQEEPQNIVWVVLTEGDLVALTYNPEQKVVGWHRHELGGKVDASGLYAPQIESVTAIPSSLGDRDEPWMIVSRYINGGVKKYVEYLGKLSSSEDAIEDSFFVDSGLTYDGAPTTTVSGLWHLEGQTVSLLADGAVHPQRTVTNGSIALITSSSKVHIGLAYQSDLETLNIEAGSENGTAQGKIKRIHSVTIRVLNMLGLYFGPSSANLDQHIFRSTADLMDAPPPLFSGDIQLDWDGDYETQGTVFLRQTDPLPGTILAIIPSLKTNER